VVTERDDGAVDTSLPSGPMTIEPHELTVNNGTVPADGGRHLLPVMHAVSIALSVDSTLACLVTHGSRATGHPHPAKIFWLKFPSRIARSRSRSSCASGSRSAGRRASACCTSVSSASGTPARALPSGGGVRAIASP